MLPWNNRNAIACTDLNNFVLLKWTRQVMYKDLHIKMAVNISNRENGCTINGR